MKDPKKEFIATSWSIDNKAAIYVAALIICLAGYTTYNSLPKESFPEVVIPTIYVATVYPGASPTDIESLITTHIEKEVKSITGIDKVSSQSVQDFCNVIIEFQTDVDIKDAKQEVREAVDRAKIDLPSDLEDDPDVVDIDLSALPIMNINLSGDYDLLALKKYAEVMQDRIEMLQEIRRIDIIGALDREVQVNVDIYKSSIAGVSMNDIINAIRFENMIVSGGQLTVDGMKRSLSVNGEFKSPNEIQNIIVSSTPGAKIYLRDIAEVRDSHKEQESFARLNKENVITLNVIKQSGENLIEASDQINLIIKEFEETILPKEVTVTITGDQSNDTRTMLHDLINTIIIGFILVTILLMFFMGTMNAVFVGLSVPLSSLITFLIFPALDYTLNMMTLFSFLLALGIVVDDAIVVIENTHRIFNNGKVPIAKAAKMAAGEVFLPILSGTMVVLSPFVPLAFWPGVIGDFMVYLPVTLIVALLSSMLVAYIINPVLAVDFMKPLAAEGEKRIFDRPFRKTSLILIGLAAVFYLAGMVGIGNFLVLMWILYFIHRSFMSDIQEYFQKNWWPVVQAKYKTFLRWTLDGWKPYGVLATVLFLFIFSIVFTAIRKPPVNFFPTGDPNYIFTYIRLPIGTDQNVTDSITQRVENQVIDVVGAHNPIVKSVISNVAIGASENDFSSASNTQSHLGKITVAFVKYSDRNGLSTKQYLNKIRDAVKDIAGAEISVNQEQNGPPTGKPINIEISGDDFDVLVKTTNDLKRYLDGYQIPGVEEIKSDFENIKPEIVIHIDREKANREGVSTGQIGGLIRSAVYGEEASKFRDVNDDYPIQVRVQKEQREKVSTLINLPVIFRDANTGTVRQIPLSALTRVEYTNSYAGIRRINQKRVISLSSNVLSGYNENEVVGVIRSHLENFSPPADIGIKITGAQEEQAETSDFLSKAYLVALGIIFMILVVQFNSISKSFIILSEIVLSVIGVLIGFSLFKMELSIVMTGIGLMALAGIVVRNGILLVEFSDLLVKQGLELKEAVAEAARTRMTPVVLTSISTILGLIPLAVGLNIDFVTLFTELNPHIYFGGDNVAFWGPLSWTMIFGLIFGTFLTLIIIPVMYLKVSQWKNQIWKPKS